MSRNEIVTTNVNRLHEERKYTQKQLAAILGISQESVSRYLRGGAKWSVDAVFAGAIALGVAVEQLIHEHK